MKKILIIAALMFAGYSANSQVIISLLFGDALNSPNVEFGLDGGINFANISNLDPGESASLFNLGFYFDIKLKQQLMLHTGVIVKSNMGAENLAVYSLDNPALDQEFADGSVTRKVNQFAVPILIKYRFGDYFHAELGPMLSLRTKGYDTFMKTMEDGEELTYKVEISDNYKRIDAGVMAGLGFKLSKIPKTTQYGVRYYYGLVDPLIDNTGKSQNFSSFYIYISIPIGAQPDKE